MTLLLALVAGLILVEDTSRGNVGSSIYHISRSRKAVP